MKRKTCVAVIENVALNTTVDTHGVFPTEFDQDLPGYLEVALGLHDVSLFLVPQHHVQRVVRVRFCGDRGAKWSAPMCAKRS